jgi:hypothetical protein
LNSILQRCILNNFLLQKTKKMKMRSKSTIMILSSLVLLYGLNSCKKEKTQLRQKEYALTAVGSLGASGSVVVSENADQSFSVRVSLTKTVKDTVHLVRMFSGSIAVPGAKALDLTNINGTGGAVTATTANIKQIRLPDNSLKNVTYDSVIKMKAFVRVFHSSFRGDSLIARGNIGNN